MASRVKHFEDEKTILASALINLRDAMELFEKYPPEWGIDEGDEYNEIAVITDRLISEWIDRLGFEKENEEALRQIMFTDDYKELLGRALSENGTVKEHKLFDSDLLLYK